MIWLDSKIHRKMKERLARDGITMRELITKFLRWYGGLEEGQDEAKADEAAKDD